MTQKIRVGRSEKVFILFLFLKMYFRGYDLNMYISTENSYNLANLVTNHSLDRFNVNINTEIATCTSLERFKVQYCQ